MAVRRHREGDLGSLAVDEFARARSESIEVRAVDSAAILARE